MPLSSFPRFSVFVLSGVLFFLTVTAQAQCSEDAWNQARQFWSEGERCLSANQFLCARDNLDKAALIWNRLASGCSSRNAEKASTYERSILQTLFSAMYQLYEKIYVSVPYEERKRVAFSFDPQLYDSIYDIGALHERFQRGDLNPQQMEIVRFCKVWYELKNGNKTTAHRFFDGLSSWQPGISFMYPYAAVEERLAKSLQR